PGRPGHKQAVEGRVDFGDWDVPKSFTRSKTHLIGPFDPSPAKGSFKKVPARFFEKFEASYNDLAARGYRILTLDAACGESLVDTVLPEKCAFVLGHEEWGHSFEVSDYPDIGCLSIPQFGKVESLNVAVAASVVMFEYVRQYGKK
ncbi:MAG: hypothetical protein JMN26_17240, partial [gamma proteobacterium endosymbiont of Lamellibrachia anaximandri]|nr:hypothetical protein [gamma proteobacterium endosymbiont of Lamellibrachia anaximandri]